MGSRIIGRSDPVKAPPDHLPVLDNDTAEWSAHTVCDPFPGQFNGLLQVFFVLFGGHTSCSMINLKVTTNARSEIYRAARAQNRQSANAPCHCPITAASSRQNRRRQFLFPRHLFQ